VVWATSTGCWGETPASASDTNRPAPDEVTPGAVVDFPDKQLGSASSEFWDHWGDGQAEIATYTGEVARYGQPRPAEMTLIYVTEPHDVRTWIKTPSAPNKWEQNVLKLNRILKFQTGIYPYSVMTSIFSPVRKWDRPRFQPAKISLTAQEWCGHVFHGVWAGTDRYLSEIHSYFADEGDDRALVETSSTPLFEDGLWIQLRELDGAFNDGESWSGKLVPALWQTRKRHVAPKPVDARITRDTTTYDGREVNRFTLRYDDHEVVFDIATDPPHHLIHYRRNQGTELTLHEVERLPYWQLNRPEDSSYRKRLGLEERIRGSQKDPDDKQDAGAGETTE
jgi:hypothetical protein